MSSETLIIIFGVVWITGMVALLALITAALRGHDPDFAQLMQRNPPTSALITTMFVVAWPFAIPMAMLMFREDGEDAHPG